MSVTTMSYFTPMTSSLLVRKGVAASSIPLAGRPEHPQIEPVADLSIGECRASGVAKKSRRVVLNLSGREYEALGLIAVKRGTSRHQLAQEAMQRYFDSLGSEYGCACIEFCMGGCE